MFTKFEVPGVSGSAAVPGEQNLNSELREL